MMARKRTTRRTALRFLGMGLCALLLMITADGALAADAGPYVLTLELDAQPDQQPDHLCVISAMGHPEANREQKDHSIGPPTASLPLSKLATLRAIATTEEGSPAGPKVEEPGALETWTF